MRILLRLLPLVFLLAAVTTACSRQAAPGTTAEDDTTAPDPSPPAAEAGAATADAVDPRATAVPAVATSPTLPAATRLFATMQAASVEGQATATRRSSADTPAAGSGDPTSSGDSAVVEDATGTTLLLVAYGPEDAPQQVLAGTRITAQFGEELIRGSAGCNDYVASVQSSGDFFAVEAVEATEEFCSEPEGIMEQERAYLAALEGVNGFRWFWEGVGEQQVLTAGELQYELPEGLPGVLQFATEQPQAVGTPAAGEDPGAGRDTATGSPLEQAEGVTFELLSLGASGSAEAVLPGTTLTLTIAGNEARGSAGCNSFSGPVNLQGSFFTLGPLTSTERACGSPAGIMEQEAAYLAALEAIDGYRWSWRERGAQRIIEGAELTYTLSDGTSGVLIFTASG